MKRNTFSPASALCAILAAAALFLWIPARGPPPAVDLEPHRPDVNRAPAHELLLLPGIGPFRAEAIVASRGLAGPFRTIGDLQRVHGIGPRTVEGLSGLATTGGRRPP